MPNFGRSSQSVAYGKPRFPIGREVHDADAVIIDRLRSHPSDPQGIGFIPFDSDGMCRSAFATKF